MSTAQEFKTKTDLIEIIHKQRRINDQAKLGKKIMRQVKLHNATHEKELKKLLSAEEKNSFVTGNKLRKKPKIKIDWEIFLTKNPKELIRYRITVPFKKYEKEIEQIAKAVVTEFGKGNYHMVDRNCEHFVFAISYGVNFSEQEQGNRDK